MSEGRERWLARIHANIEAHGYHVTVVSDDEQVPRYAYTIGLSRTVGFELVLAGAIALLLEDVLRVITSAHDTVRSDGDAERFSVPELGHFDLGVVDSSWARTLLLGIFDVYAGEQVPVKQIIPTGDLRTIDVPDLAEAWKPGRDPVWRYVYEPWDLPVPKESKGVTDLNALRGAPISEAMRWEEDNWELFAGVGPEIPREQVRIVPLGGLVAFDPTLEPVVHLGVEEGLMRDPPGSWRPWG